MGPISLGPTLLAIIRTKKTAPARRTVRLEKLLAGSTVTRSNSSVEHERAADQCRVGRDGATLKCCNLESKRGAEFVVRVFVRNEIEECPLALGYHPLSGELPA